MSLTNVRARRTVPPRLTLLALALLSCGVAAAPLRAQEGGPAAPAQPLPLKDVVLFSSGVGYFQRRGTVRGTTSLKLSFRAGQVNDILKSLVLIDPQGQVRPVTYTTQDAHLLRPGVRALATGSSVSLGALLRQFQGARLRLHLAKEQVEGRLVSVSSKVVPPVRDGHPPVEQEVLNVLTATGLRAVPLEAVQQVQLLDERLDRELRDSLALLATGLSDEQREVELRFTGDAAREVRAGYLQETPVWKTSYRLVLDDKPAPGQPATGQQPAAPAPNGAGGAYLQGWAIVENTTGEDWRDVRLSLVSGRPISFIQDLYQPLYVPRPVVQPQVVGSPRPQLYGEAVEVFEDAKAAATIARMPKITGSVNLGARAGAAGDRGPQGPPGPAGAPGPSDRAALEQLSRERRRDLGLSIEGVEGTQAQAEGAERGELFEYAIQQPVTLPRGKAAMVPIVGAGIQGERLSIFDPSADSRHALRGFRLKNTTGLDLSGGPITVFEDDAYAGDAQVGHVGPGEERLLAYAVDLDLVADQEGPQPRAENVTISIKSGVLHITRKQHLTRTYSFRNKGKTAKTLLVQQAKDEGFDLAQPKTAAEITPEAYRFRVTVAPGETEKLTVSTERPVTETVALLDADLDLLLTYTRNDRVSPEVKRALEELVTRRRKITELQGRRAAVEAELKEIDAEQARIRQNMERLDRNSPLYMQYVQKLTEQEAQIETLRAEQRRLRQQEAEAQQELRQYLDSLSVG
ncbi:MAG: hypothetical protein ACK47B_07275 [Armatimonadota bacterium]